jgi:hypothetical protein
MLAPLKSGAKPLTHQFSYAAQYGHRLTGCKCKAIFSTDAHGMRHLEAEAGLSCFHTVQSVFRGMVEQEWTYDDVFSLLFLEPNDLVGFRWLYVQDSPVDTFEEMWESAKAFVQASPSTNRVRGTNRPFEKFEYRYSVWVIILNVVEANPDFSENLICKSLPYRKGITAKYLQEGVRRGYLTVTVGARRKKTHTVVYRPSPPRPFLWRIRKEEAAHKAAVAYQEEHGIKFVDAENAGEYWEATGLLDLFEGENR